MWNYRHLIGVSLVALSCSAALAAAPSDKAVAAQQCQSLQGEFQAAERQTPPSTQRREARYFATEGRSWCETEHPRRGAADLDHALQILHGHDQGGPAPS